MIQFDEHFFQMGWNHQLVLIAGFLLVLLFRNKYVNGQLIDVSMPFEVTIALTIIMNAVTLQHAFYQRCKNIVR